MTTIFSYEDIKKYLAFIAKYTSSIDLTEIAHKFVFGGTIDEVDALVKQAVDDEITIIN